MQPTASSVYEFTPETLADRDMESRVSAATDSNSNDQSDSGYNESTETVIEEDILEELRVLYLGPSRRWELCNGHRHSPGGPSVAKIHSENRRDRSQVRMSCL